MATCSSPSSSRDIDSLLSVYIQNAEDLIAQCQQLELKDARKLEKKCRAELRYLLSLKRRRKTFKDCDIRVQEHHLHSSNLSHFAAILHAVHNLPKVKHILRPFSSTDRSESMVVDVVAQDGLVWVKAIARKAQALHLIWAGKGQYGDRDIVRQAKDYVKCAAEHPINFFVPQIHYAFYNEVTEPMAAALEAIGVKVWGNRIPVSIEVQNQVNNPENISDEEIQNEDLEDIQDLSDEGVENISDFHIPSASEFMSFSRKGKIDNTKHLEYVGLFGDDNENEIDDLKHFQEINISGDTFETDNSKLFNNNELKQEKHHEFCDNQVDCSFKHSGDSTEKEDKNFVETKVQRSNVKHLMAPDNIESKHLEMKREEMFLTILGNAPVYSFPDIGVDEINKVTPDFVVDVSKVNLDITTMITLVSSITHGGCNYVFREKILSLQAKEERECPVLPELEKYLKDKEWFVCRTAVEDFQTILDTLGGDNEKKRAKELLEKCKVVPDQPSLRSQTLPQTGKIRDRSKVIFGTGDQLKCVTVSANSGFVRAAEHQGIVFAVYLHQSRALTEKKEKIAQRLTE